MRRLKIALDMDSVLDDLMIPVMNYVNGQLGTTFKKADLSTWMFLERLKLNEIAKLKGVPELTYNGIFEACWKKWEEIPSCEKDVGKLTLDLNHIGNVDIVTAAGGYVSEEQRRQWLDKQDIIYNKLVVVPMHGGSGKSGLTTKLSLDYDLWIDDNPADARSAIKNHKQFFLYDQPWNRDIQTPTMTVTRVRTLKTVITVLAGRGSFRGVKPAYQLYRGLKPTAIIFDEIKPEVKTEELVEKKEDVPQQP